jgi:hypothetical protein
VRFMYVRSTKLRNMESVVVYKVMHKQDGKKFVSLQVMGFGYTNTTDRRASQFFGAKTNDFTILKSKTYQFIDKSIIIYIQGYMFRLFRVIFRPSKNLDPITTL